MDPCNSVEFFVRPPFIFIGALGRRYTRLSCRHLRWHLVVTARKLPTIRCSSTKLVQPLIRMAWLLIRKA